jgi:hypothetical protein
VVMAISVYYASMFRCWLNASIVCWLCRSMHTRLALLVHMANQVCSSDFYCFSFFIYSHSIEIYCIWKCRCWSLCLSSHGSSVCTWCHSIDSQWYASSRWKRMNFSWI